MPHEGDEGQYREPMLKQNFSTSHRAKVHVHHLVLWLVEDTYLKALGIGTAIPWTLHPPAAWGKRICAHGGCRREGWCMVASSELFTNAFSAAQPSTG